jgi:hypothetical protein
MAQDNFLQLSNKVTINLDKVEIVEWTEGAGHNLRAYVTYESGKHRFYGGAEARSLRQALNHNSNDKIISGGTHASS